MGGSTRSDYRPIVVGANHRSSSLSLRDRLFVEDSDVPGFLNQLKAMEISEALLISTCDRVEVLALHDDPNLADTAIRSCFANLVGDLSPKLDSQCYTYIDDMAVEQIFAVASSLDSQILGEPQILGQIKSAHRIARELDMVGSELEALLQTAYSVAKRVRTETSIGERSVSIAGAAVDLARDVHGDLSKACALLIGTGDMGHLVAQHLQSGGLGHLIITHPLENRAAVLAADMGCLTVEYADRAKAVARADVIITALGRGGYALNADMVLSALKARRMEPVFLVDLAVPGDVDPAINRIDAAFLYELSDLERIVSDGRASRESEAGAGRQIVLAEVTAFQNQRVSRTAVPLVVLLRRHAEKLREEILQESGGDACKATRLLISRLMHNPSIALRNAASGAPGELEALDRAVRKLFQFEADIKLEKTEKRDDVL